MPITIPKIWHLIWIGSDIPAEYKSNIRVMMRHNPDYEFRLYIDSAILPLTPLSIDDPSICTKVVDSIKEFCARPLRDSEKKITLYDVANLPPHIPFAAECAQFVAQPFYNDWVNGEDKNYAFAVDLLRLAILYACGGGIYSDLDCISISSVGTLSNESGLFFCGGELNNPTAANPEQKLIYGDNWFIATYPRNKILLQILYRYYLGYSNLILAAMDCPLGVSSADIPFDPHRSELAFTNPVIFSDNKSKMANRKFEEEIYSSSYIQFRKNIPHNSGIKLGRFGFVTTVKHLIATIMEVHGEEGLKQSLFPMQGFLHHYEAKSWNFTGTIQKVDADNDSKPNQAEVRELFRLRRGVI